MTDTQPTFAVVGAAGQQGMAVTRALAERGAGVRALVRDPAAAKVDRLRRLGAEPFRADLDEPETLSAAFEGVDAAFAMTTFAGEHGTEGEVQHGKAIVDAAVRVGLPRLVYSSVGGAERRTGIPHFESKRRVEEYLLERIPGRFVRPVYFMENLAGLMTPTDDPEVVVRLPLPADVALQMVAVRDIGRVAAALLLDPDAIDPDGVEIAGDELTGPQIAERIGAQLGKPTRYEELPLSVFDSNGDLQAMFAWFAELPAYRADWPATRRLDPDVLDLSGWLRHEAADS